MKTTTTTINYNNIYNSLQRQQLVANDNGCLRHLQGNIREKNGTEHKKERSIFYSTQGRNGNNRRWTRPGQGGQTVVNFVVKRNKVRWRQWRSQKVSMEVVYTCVEAPNVGRVCPSPPGKRFLETIMPLPILKKFFLLSSAFFDFLILVKFEWFNWLISQKSG